MSGVAATQTPAARVLVVGGIHGDELTSVSIVFRWIELLKQPASGAGAYEWRVIPVLNPDGLAHGTVTAQSPEVHYPLKIPAGYFFAMGDNREASSDSRSFGPQPYDRIIGKVILRFWPLDRLIFFAW